MTQKLILIFFLFICFLSIGACEKRFEVDIDGNVRTKTIDLESSTLTIETYCVSRVFFFITIRSEPKDMQQSHIFFYPDAFNIMFKDMKIPYEIYDKEKPKEIFDNPISLDRYKYFEIQFHINTPLPLKGDAIILEDNGYLYHKDKRIDIGNIIITII